MAQNASRITAIYFGVYHLVKTLIQVKRARVNREKAVKAIAYSVFEMLLGGFITEGAMRLGNIIMANQ